VRLVLFVVLFCAASQVFADNRGRFEIIDADSRVEGGMWLVDARADLVLSDDAIEALENSIALNIQYQYEVTRRRRLWPDKVIVEPTRNIELSYLSLSQRYLVHYLDTGEQASYATLYSALRQIGQTKEYPLIEASRIDLDDRNYVVVRVVLNREKLPGPLRVLAFWRGDFSLESEWFRWRLK